MSKVILDDILEKQEGKEAIKQYSNNIFKILIFVVTIFPIIYVPPRSESFPGQLYLMKFVGFIVITLWGVFYYLKYGKKMREEVKKMIYYIKPFNYLIGGFLIAVFISAVFAKYKLGAFLGMPNYYIGFLFYIISFIFLYLIFISFNYIDIKKLSKYAYIGFSILGIVMHIQYFYGDIIFRIGSRFNIAFFIGFGNRNFAVHPFSYLFLICFIQIINSKDRKEQYKLFIPLSIFYSVILISLTRGAWLPLGIDFVFFIVYTLIKQKELIVRQKRIIAIILLLFIIIFIADNIFGNWTIYGRLPRTIKPLEDIEEKGLESALNSASSKRIDLWKSGIILLQKNPIGWIIGIGPAAFYSYSDEYSEVRNKFTSIHNQYLEVLVTIGIIGLVIYCLWLLLILYYGNYITKKDYSNFGAWLSIIYFCFASLFISIHSINFIYLLIILGYTLNQYSIKRIDEKEKYRCE